MIAAQFPNATAVAPFDVWSDRFGRRIRAGEKGIGLIDDSGNYPKMKYVFDISQSDRFKDVPQPFCRKNTRMILFFLLQVICP